MTDLSLNMAQCLRDATYIGYTRIFNTCAGTQSDVPWGTLDWFAFLILCAILSLPVAGFVWWNYPRWRYHAIERLKAESRK